jgi:hypothetical protein
VAAACKFCADVIRVCVKLLVAAGKWQNSGRTPAAVVFSVMADVIQLLRACHVAS